MPDESWVDYFRRMVTPRVPQAPPAPPISVPRSWQDIGSNLQKSGVPDLVTGLYNDPWGTIGTGVKKWWESGEPAHLMQRASIGSDIVGRTAGGYVDKWKQESQTQPQGGAFTSLGPVVEAVKETDWNAPIESLTTPSIELNKRGIKHPDPVMNAILGTGVDMISDPTNALPLGPVDDLARLAATPFLPFMKAKGFKQLAHGTGKSVEKASKIVEEGFDPRKIGNQTDIIGQAVHAAGVSAEDFAESLRKKQVPTGPIAEGYGGTQIPMSMRPEAQIIDTTGQMPWEDIAAVISALDPVKDAKVIAKIKSEFKAQARPQRSSTNPDAGAYAAYAARQARTRQAAVEKLENTLLHEKVYGRGSTETVPQWAPLNHPAMGEMQIPGKGDVGGIWHRDLMASNRPNMAARPESYLVQDPGYWHPGRAEEWQPFKTLPGQTWPRDLPAKTPSPLGAEGKGGVMYHYPQEQPLSAQVRRGMKWKNLPPDQPNPFPTTTPAAPYTANKIGGSTRPATGNNAAIVENMKTILAKNGLNPKFYLYSPALMDYSEQDLYGTVVKSLKNFGGGSKAQTMQAAQEIEALWKGGAQVMAPSKGKIGQPVAAGKGKELPGSQYSNDIHAKSIQDVLESHKINVNILKDVDISKHTPAELYEITSQALKSWGDDLADSAANEIDELWQMQIGPRVPDKAKQGKYGVYDTFDGAVIKTFDTEKEAYDWRSTQPNNTNLGVSRTDPSMPEPGTFDIDAPTSRPAPGEYGSHEPGPNLGKVMSPEEKNANIIGVHLKDIKKIFAQHGLDGNILDSVDTSSMTPENLHKQVADYLKSGPYNEQLAGTSVDELWKNKKAMQDLAEPPPGMGKLPPIKTPLKSTTANDYHLKDIHKILTKHGLDAEGITGLAADQNLSPANLHKDIADYLKAGSNQDERMAANEINALWQKKAAMQGLSGPGPVGKVERPSWSHPSTTAKKFDVFDEATNKLGGGQTIATFDSVEEAKAYIAAHPELDLDYADHDPKYAKVATPNDKYDVFDSSAPASGKTVKTFDSEAEALAFIEAHPNKPFHIAGHNPQFPLRKPAGALEPKAKHKYSVYNVTTGKPVKIFDTADEAKAYITNNPGNPNLVWDPIDANDPDAFLAQVQPPRSTVVPGYLPDPGKAWFGGPGGMKTDIFNVVSGKTVKTFDTPQEAHEYLKLHDDMGWSIGPHLPYPSTASSAPPKPDLDAQKLAAMNKALKAAGMNISAEDLLESLKKTDFNAAQSLEAFEDVPAPKGEGAGGLDWSTHPIYGEKTESVAPPKIGGISYNVVDKDGKTVKTFATKSMATVWAKDQPNARHLTVHGHEVSGWAGPGGSPDPNFKHPPATTKIETTPGTFTKKDVDTSHKAGWGGSHEKQVYTKGGQDYLFKPSWGVKYAPDQELTANNVAKLAGLKVPEMSVETIGGQRGTMQSLHGNRGDWPSLRSKGQSIEKLSTTDLQDIIRNQPVDWLTANHDAHQGQWLVTPTGIIEIDRGQAFKHFGEDSLSKDYNPNAKYGEEPSIYIAIHKLWKAGKLPQLTEKDITEATYGTTTQLHKNWSKVMEHLSEALQRAGKSDLIPEASERFSRLQTSMNKFWTK